MATQTTGGGSTTSLTNTPQAKDDTYTKNEDYLGISYFDVMLNDLGGNAKILWSIDNGPGSPTDLITQDLGRAESTMGDKSLKGANIWITSDGKVGYDAACLTAAFKAELQALAVGQTAKDSFTYAIRLANGTLSWATVTIEYQGANDAPVAHADINGTDLVVESGVYPGNTSLAGDSSASGNVLTNDTDVDSGAMLTVKDVNGATGNVGNAVEGTYGSVTINANGSWTYNLNNVDADTQALFQGQSVTEVFTYTVKDEYGATSTSTLTITITGTNDGPVANADSDAAGENETILVDVLANDSDVDTGHVLTVTAASAPAGQGTASVVGNQVQFDPGSDFDYLDDGETATVTVSYTIEDEHGASSSSTVEITVHGSDDQPTLGAVTSGSVAEDDQASTTTDSGLAGTLDGDDVDAGDTLEYGIDGGSAGPGPDEVSLVGAYGTLTVNTLTGAYSYAKNAGAIEALDDGASDSDVFTVTVTDGDGALVTQSYTVNVSGADDAPTLGAVTSGSVAEDDQASTTTDSGLAGTLDGDDVDAGDTLEYGIDGGSAGPGPDEVSLVGAYGTLTVNTLTGAYSYAKNAGAIEALDDGASDSDVFTVTVTDGDGALVTQSYTVNVSGADDAPTLGAVTSGSVAEDDQASTTTDSGLAGTLDGDDVDAGDTLEYGIDGGSAGPGPDEVSLVGAYGTLTVNTLTGAYSYAKNAGAIEALDDGASDSDVFTVTVTDGDGALVTQSYTVNVSGADDAPTLGAVTSGSVAEDDQASTTTDSGLAGTLDGDDVDAGDTLEYGIDGGSAGPGPDEVSLVGAYGTLTVNTLTGAYSYAKNAGAIEALDDGASDSDVFTVTVTDGDGALVTQSYTVNVSGADDAPTLGAVTSGSVAEDDQASTTTDSGLAGTLDGDDVDAGDTLEYGIDGGSAGPGPDEVSLVGAYGTLTVNTLTGAYSYAKNAGAIEALDDGASDSDVFTVTVTDGDGALVTQSYTVNVSGADDAPTLGAVTSGSVAEDDQASTTTDSGLAGTLDGDDVDAGDTLEYGIDGGSAGPGPDEVSLVGAYGTLTVNTLTGAYSYAKNAGAIEALDDGASDSDVFTVTVTDGDGALVTQSYTVNVSGADDAPTLGAVTSGSVAEDDQASTTTDSGLAGTLDGDDVDAGDTLEYGIDGGSAGPGPDEVSLVGAYGTLTVNTLTGAYSYAKNAGAIEALDDGASDSDVFTVTVTDGDGALVTQSYTVNVSGADDAPTLGAVTSGSVAEDDQASTTTDSGLAGTLDGDDVDAGDTLEYGIDGGSAGPGPDEVSLVGAYGTLTVNTLTGAYSYAKNAGAIEALDDGASDSDVFTVTVTDGDGALVTQSYTVNVSGADDAPTLGAVTSGSVAEDDQASTTTDSGLAGTLDGDDVDAGDTLEYGIDGGSAGPGPDEVSLVGAYGTLTVNTLTGAYSYAKNAGAIEALDDGASDSDVFTVTVTDGDGALVTQSYTVNVSGADDAPTLGAVTSGSVAEDDQASTTTDSGLAGTLDGDDVDAGDTLEYGIDGGSAGPGPDEVSLVGAYGTLTVNTLTGAYSYAKNAGAIEALDDGASDSDVFTVTVTDGDGALVTQSYTVNVSGADDAPTLGAVTSGSVAEDDQASTTTDSGLAGTLDGDDVDAGDTLEYGIDGGSAGPGPDEVSLVGAYGTLTVNTLTGAYSYAKNAGAIEALDDGASDSDVFTVTVTDGDGALVTQSYTVNVSGADDAPTLGAVTSGSVAEDDQASTTTDSGLAGTLDGDDVDAGDTLEYGIDGGSAGPGPDEVSLVGAYGTLTVNTLTGAYSYAKNAGAIEALDDGASDSDVFTVTVTDGDGALVTQSYTVNVSGANDSPVANLDTGSAGENENKAFDVVANDTDVDDGAVLTLFSIDGVTVDGVAASLAEAGAFAMVAGEVQFTPGSAFDHLALGDSASVVVSYTVKDQHGAAASSTLTLTVTGTNDGASIVAEPGGDYEVIEAGGVANMDSIDWSAQGQVTVTDVDDGEAVFQTPPSLDGIYGTFTFDSNTGQWTYDIDNDRAITEALNVGDEVTDTLTVTSADGTDSFDIVVTITGSNDAAIITGTTSGTVAEATPSDPGDPDATGTLFASDVDNPDNVFIAQGSTATATGYGSYTMSAAGVWAYALNNANPVVNGLMAGMFLIDTFTVQSADGTTQTITVTINGATDVVAIIQPPTFNGADPNDNDTAGPAAGAVVTVSSSSGTDTWNGTNGIDTINAGSGSDNVYGHDGNDVINGENGQDVSLYGQVGNDTISGGSGQDQIFGGSGADILYGNQPPAGDESGDAGDTIYGGSGNDTIFGQGAGDIIIGGYGADILSGGGGIDIFRYLSVLDTNDTITDLGNTDKIDLLAIDANSILGGDQTFGWGGMAPTPNALWFDYDAGTNTTTLFGDVDGNPGTAEFMLTLQNYNGFASHSSPLSPPPEIIF